MDRLRKVLYLWRMAQMVLPEVCINTPPLIYRCETGWRWCPAALPDFDLWYVLDGVGTVELNGVTQAVAAQTCFIFSPGSQIVAHHDPQHRLRVFAVHFDWKNHRRFRLPADGIRVRDAVFFSALARRCAASYRQGTAVAHRQSAALVAQMLLHLWAEAEQLVTSVMDSRISAAVELIREEPGRRCTVAEMAQKAGLSRSQFTRQFTTATGLSPERFFIQARIERATQLLHETSMTISQIADALGYRDVFYFSRQFRQITGKPASACRC